MTREEAHKRLVDLADEESEEFAHEAADDILVSLIKELGWHEIVDAYCDITKVYS